MKKPVFLKEITKKHAKYNYFRNLLLARPCWIMAKETLSEDDFNKLLETEILSKILFKRRRHIQLIHASLRRWLKAERQAKDEGHMIVDIDFIISKLEKMVRLISKVNHY